MEVFRSREVIHEQSELIVERYDAMHYGSAVQSSAVVALESALLGKTFADHLTESGLLEVEA